MDKVLFIGTGAWATGLANVLMHKKCKIMMYGIDDKEINDLSNQLNTKYFKDKKLLRKPDVISKDLKALVEMQPDFIVFAVPSFCLMDNVKKVKQYLINKPIIINVAKGFNPVTNHTFSIDIKKEFRNKIKGLVSLLGPSFASEVFNKEITVINAVGSNKEITLKVENLFKTNFFKCSYEKNEQAAEYCAAFKNVIAIATGLTYALHLSINTRAAIFTQGIKEIGAILKKKKLSAEVLYNYCGVGDIFLTCTDELSRNFRFGQLIANYGTKKAFKMNTSTVEGIYSLKIAKKLVVDLRIRKSPVICSLYDVIYNNKNPKTFVKQVLGRIVE